MRKLLLNKATLCSALIMVAIVFVGCSESDSDDSDNPGVMNGRTIKLERLELELAKYLSLTGNSTRATGDAEVGLFKIDNDGNITTVVLSCTEEEDGGITRTRKDIKVTPRYIYSLSGTYTFMEDCSFYDGDGNSVNMNQYYEPEAFYFNILVRNADGAIFYIPASLSDTYFLRANESNLCGSTADDKGNLYLHSVEGNLGMITMQNGQLVLKQVNPDHVRPYGEIISFDNGTVMVYDPNYAYSSCTFFYPNGGFEEYDKTSEGIVSLTKLPNGVKAVVVTEGSEVGEQTEYIVSLHDFHVGTSFGGNALSAPLASLSSGTDYSLFFNHPNYLDWLSKYHANRDWLSGVYETANAYIIGKTLIVDKRTMEIRPLEGTEAYVIFPTAENTYKGLSWIVGSWGAEWYDIETMQYGRVDFNLPTDFMKTNETADIPSGKLIIQGTRYADGKSVTYFVDIETGNYVCTETDSERPITALIPLN